MAVSANRLELLQIADAVAREKSIDRGIVIAAMEDAIAKAARARYGSETDVHAEIDAKKGELRLSRHMLVVEQVENSSNQISLEDARRANPGAQIGDTIIEHENPAAEALPGFEEIKAMVTEGTEAGTIDEAEQEIIERVFHLGDRNITSLMTHRSDIIWFSLDDNEEKMKQKIISERHSIYPICDGDIDQLKGIISIKDLYVSDDSTLFKDLMKPALFVPENNSAYQVMEKFKESQLHSAFIVDEYGTILGMITLNDILEAIVGDIPQPDLQDYSVTRRDDGSYLIDGQIPFYDFLSYFDKADWMGEGEHEFDTLAGFILHELERIPQTGDKMDWRGFNFEIIDMDGHRIDKILVTASKEITDEIGE